MSAILEGIAAGAASGAANSVVGYYTQKNLARQQQANYRKNLKLQNELNIEAQRRVTEQSLSALRNAGISPALAAAGHVSAPAASAPLGGAPSVDPKFDFSSALLAGKELELLKEQKENIKSQTNANNAAANKANAEAEEVEQRKIGSERVNLHAADYDKTINEQMREAYKVFSQDSNLSQAEREYYDALAKSPNDYSRGTLQAQRDFASYLNELDEYQKEAVLRVLTKKITELQLKDEPTLEALAFAPKQMRSKMIAETADLWSSKKWRDWQRETLGPAQAELLGTEKDVKEHSDFVGMVDDGNYFGAAMYLLPSLVQGLSTAYVYGRMLNAGKKVVDKVGNKVTQKEVDNIYDNLPAGQKQTSTPVFKKLNNDTPHPTVTKKNEPTQRDIHGQLIHDNRETYNSVRASLGERNTDILYKRYLNEKHTNETFKQWLSRENPLIK